MAATTSSSALTMKLLIDASPQRRRVLFAEAGKDVVDFLFSLLALPVGTAVKLLGKESMVGCFGNLYASVEKLDDTYVQPGAAKDAILCPTITTAASPNSSIFRLPAPTSGQSKSLFKCPNYYCNNYVTDASGTKCPNCGNQMAHALQYAPSDQNAGAEGANGLVMRVVTYTVTDDLTITPMSVISTITQLNTYARRGGVLQEKTVQLGYKEGVEILKASLQSKTVLTDVFLGNKLPSNKVRGNESLAWRV